MESKIQEQVLKEMWKQGQLEEGMGDLKTETAINLTIQKTIDEVKAKVEKCLVRSGWEMLPARRLVNDEFSKRERINYDIGTREMEQVWHEIIKELLNSIEEINYYGKRTK